MRFSINKMELQNALNIIMKGVSNRSTLPILSGIYVETATDSITLQSTDLELSVQYTVSALIEEPGKTVIPGKLFSEIIRSLPDAAIHVQTNDTGAQITCDTSTFSVRTLNPEDFPGFPTVDTNQSITIPASTFIEMAKKVSKVVSRDESRVILTGVLIEFEEDSLKMVATDSYRLALAKTKMEGTGSGEFQAVIAGSFMSDVCSVIPADEEVTLSLAENQVVITCGNTIFINRRIEGNYPDYRQLLPTDHTTRVTLDLGPFSSSVKRASILSSSSAPMRFDINNATQTLQVFVNSADVGSVQETMSCGVEGEDVEIAFNSSYVNDGLSVFKGDQVFFDAQTSMKPGVFRTVEDDSFLYLIMPVRI